MEHAVEFTNFVFNQDKVSADLLVDGTFLVTFTGSLAAICSNKPTIVTLYRCFEVAVRQYLTLGITSKH